MGFPRHWDWDWEKKKPPKINEKKDWDFTLYGKRFGRDVWYRWNNGEITTNEPEIIEFLKLLKEHIPDGYQSFDEQSWDAVPYADVFTNPQVFRMIVQKEGFTEFQGIRGEAPEPKRPSII